MTKCVFPGCAGTGAKFHRIPRRDCISQRWKAEINSPSLENLQPGELNKLFVCSNHFLDSDYSTGSVSRRQLNPTAVPKANIQRIEQRNGDDCDRSEIECEVLLSDSEQSPIFPTTVDDADTTGIQESFGTTERTAMVQSESQSKETPAECYCQQQIKELKSRVEMLEKKNRILNQKIRRQKNQWNKVNKVMKSDRVRKWNKFSIPQKIIVNMQYRNAGKKPKGRRFTRQEKAKCLIMMKKSRGCYDYLSSNIIVPGESTLLETLASIPCFTGLTHVVLSQLHEYSKTMDKDEKICLLMWDEINLMTHVQHDRTSDKIAGFEDWGYRRTAKFADHAIVFLIRSIKAGWTLPVFYGFCQSATQVRDIQKCIKKITEEVVATGLSIVATTCDQAPINRRVIQKLIDESIKERSKLGLPHRNTIKISMSELIPTMDLPHVLKGSRNNFLTKPLDLGLEEQSDSNQSPAQLADVKQKGKPRRKRAYWSVVEKTYKIDQQSHGLYPKLKKIRDDHIHPKNRKKMKVNHAAQVLSRTFADCIRSFVAKDYVGLCRNMEPIDRNQGADTAEALEFFNDLFDYGKSPPTPSEPALRTLVTDKSPHVHFWGKAKSKLLRMEYVDPKTLSTPKNKSYAISSWIMNIDGFQKLWKLLKEQGFTEFKPKYISQDPLENFFGTIRALSTNDNPSCWQFTGNFKALLICNLSNQQLEGSSVENTGDEGLLFTLENLLTNDSGSSESMVASDVDQEFENAVAGGGDCNNILEITVSDSADEIKRELFKDPILKGVVECCANCQLSFQRATCGENNKSDFDLTYQKISQCLHTVMPKVCHFRKITAVIIDRVLQDNESNWIKCHEDQHRISLHEKIVKIITDHFINNWCTMINRHLKGVSSHLRTHPMFKEAIELYEKHNPKGSRQSSDDHHPLR